MDVESLKGKVVEFENFLYKDKKGVLYRFIIETIEKPLFECALERTAGNQLKAARILGINRNTMRSKIRKLGIDPNNYKHL
ncbi:MAG: helix-turn-helix domain-containing protein [Candidatus Omnitrophota bacterium]|jgi:two-component system nitrogen regulation response regulator GlnG